jgi:hypothetical protein
MIFRRPELEKDNPIAPEPYVGPRRRLALAHAAASKEFTQENDLKKTLRALTLAASRYVDSLPKAKKKDREFKELQNAIARAERVLSSGDGRSGPK